MQAIEYARTEIPGYEVIFPVVGPSGEDLGGLTVIAKAVNTESPGIWRGHLVEVDIILRNGEFLQGTSDYFRISEVVDLCDILQDFQNGTSGTLTLTTVEPGFDLELAWCEFGKVVQFNCCVPSRSGQEHLWNILEFWVAPEQLTGPVVQLDELLNRLDQFAGEGPRRRRKC